MRFRTVLFAGITLVLAGSAQAESTGEPGFVECGDDASTSCAAPCSSNRPFRFFAMDTGIRDEAHQTPDAQAKMVAALGYDGIGASGPAAGFAEMLKALDCHGLAAYPVYVGLDIETDLDALPEDLLEICRLVADRQATLWLYLTSRDLNPSDPVGDEKAAALVSALSARAGRVALYPHTNFWMERFEDAVRLSERIDSPCVGATFNLCHWLKVEGDQDPRPSLESAFTRGRLHVVTINGADGGETKAMPWNRLIQNLDQGSYDVEALVQHLHKIGYRGPVGLQGYGIGGDVDENLRRSMEAWVRVCAGLEG